MAGHDFGRWYINSTFTQLECRIPVSFDIVIDIVKSASIMLDFFRYGSNYAGKSVITYLKRIMLQ